MSLATWRTRLEKVLFGSTFDDVYDQIGELNRSVDALSSRLDEGLARIRKELYRKGKSTDDPRDGLYIVEDDCIGCQICVDIAPETFKMRDDGIAMITDSHGAEFEKIKEAMEGCGSSCIKIA